MNLRAIFAKCDFDKNTFGIWSEANYFLTLLETEDLELSIEATQNDVIPDKKSMSRNP